MRHSPLFRIRLCRCCCRRRPYPIRLLVCSLTCSLDDSLARLAYLPTAGGAVATGFPSFAFPSPSDPDGPFLQAAIVLRLLTLLIG